MKSTSTPYTHVGYTSKDLVLTFGASGSAMKHTVNVPSGTRCHKPEGCPDSWLVADLSCIPGNNFMAFHDAYHFGIPVPEDELVEISEVQSLQSRPRG